jgi:hypothetical protein
MPQPWIPTTKEQAVSTASDRLAAIELWARLTFFAAVALVTTTGIIAVVGLYGAVEYTRAKWAVQEASAAMSRQIASQGHPRPMPLPRR